MQIDKIIYNADASRRRFSLSRAHHRVCVTVRPRTVRQADAVKIQSK
jgi:hypothetical protein